MLKTWDPSPSGHSGGCPLPFIPFLLAVDLGSRVRVYRGLGL